MNVQPTNEAVDRLFARYAQSTVAFFERVCPFFEVALHVIACRTLDVETDRHVPIAHLQDKLDEAYELGKALGAA